MKPNRLLIVQSVLEVEELKAVRALLESVWNILSWALIFARFARCAYRRDSFSDDEFCSPRGSGVCCCSGGVIFGVGLVAGKENDTTRLWEKDPGGVVPRRSCGSVVLDCEGVW